MRIASRDRSSTMSIKIKFRLLVVYLIEITAIKPFVMYDILILIRTLFVQTAIKMVLVVTWGTSSYR